MDINGENLRNGIGARSSLGHRLLLRNSFSPRVFILFITAVAVTIRIIRIFVESRIKEINNVVDWN
jgi:hypothetical protein